MEHVLSLSFGKDSLACLGAIRHLGWPLDRIVHAEVWATDKIHGELPVFREEKERIEKRIKDLFGLEVEHIRSKRTYEDVFYSNFESGKREGTIYGWPFQKGPWCNSRLKMSVLDEINRGNIVYLGIAAGESERIERHAGKPNIKMPLVELGWEEDLCGLWCKYTGVLPRYYESYDRNGCWFCHNQGVQQLRLLRKNYPEYWALMLKWDNDSPVTFHADGHTVHDFERRFQMEDEGLLFPDDRNFRWSMLDDDSLNYRLF